MDGIGFAMYKRNRRCVLGMNFTDAVKRYRYGKVQPPVYCSLLSYFRFPYREEMLPAIRHAKVSVIPGGYFFVGQNYLFL